MTAKPHLNRTYTVATRAKRKGSRLPDSHTVTYCNEAGIRYPLTFYTVKSRDEFIAKLEQDGYTQAPTA